MAFKKLNKLFVGFLLTVFVLSIVAVIAEEVNLTVPNLRPINVEPVTLNTSSIQAPQIAPVQRVDVQQAPSATVPLKIDTTQLNNPQDNQVKLVNPIPFKPIPVITFVTIKTVKGPDGKNIYVRQAYSGNSMVISNYNSLNDARSGKNPIKSGYGPSETSFGEGDSNVIYIDKCSVLNQSGMTYKLNKSLIGADVKGFSNGACFDIQADNISLDCQNYYVNNANLYNYSYVGTNNTNSFFGIYSNKNYITVKNCNISIGRTYTFTNLMNAKRIINGYGAYFLDSNNLMIYDNVFKDNYKTGLYLDGVSSSNVYNNEIRHNSLLGVGIDGMYVEGTNNNIYNNKVILNSGWGIKVASANNNKIFNNIIQNNGGYSLQMSSSNNNILSNNTIDHSGWGGDWTVTGIASSFPGLHLSSSNNNTITSNLIKNNHDNSIYLVNSNNNSVYKNTFQANWNNTVKVYLQSKGNLIYNNTVKN